MKKGKIPAEVKYLVVDSAQRLQVLLTLLKVHNNKDIAVVFNHSNSVKWMNDLLTQLDVEVETLDNNNNNNNSSKHLLCDQYYPSNGSQREWTIHYDPIGSADELLQTLC